jgi:hypothetical protein
MSQPFRCPKCKNTTIRIVEHIVCPEEMFQTKSGQVTNYTGRESSACYVIKWTGECWKCGKKWLLRKAPRPDQILWPKYMKSEDITKWLEKN